MLERQSQEMKSARRDELRGHWMRWKRTSELGAVAGRCAIVRAARGLLGIAVMRTFECSLQLTLQVFQYA